MQQWTWPRLCRKPPLPWEHLKPITRKFALIVYSFGALLATALAEQFSDQIESLFLLAPETEAETAELILPKRIVYHMSNLDPKIDHNELFAYRATAVLESQDIFNLFKKVLTS